MKVISSMMIAMGIFFVSAWAQQDAAKQSAIENGRMHEHTQQAMNKRGDQGMGFAQERATHHFLLRNDGGAIQVTAKSADDKASIAEIRMHLEHIAHAFQGGDFNIPIFVHDQTPPGVTEMTRLKDQISYRFQAQPNGGTVEIRSANRKAIDAIHRFLRFQIKKHETGDPLEPR